MRTDDIEEPCAIQTPTDASKSASESALPDNATSPEPDFAVQVEHLEGELRTLRENLLLSMADLDNMRKRAAREQKEARDYAVTHFARDILSVSDNLDRALSALPKEGTDPQIATVIQGVQLVQQELMALLGRHHIQKVPALGEKFDPHWHQAMLEVETADQAPGMIMQVLQEGYKIADRLLRPALVSVSKIPNVEKAERPE